MGKKSVLKTAWRLYLLLAVLFLMTNCGPDPLFIRVAFIDGVPSTGIVGTPLTLTGTVNPSFATNNAIVWLITNTGGTGAVISGNILNTETEGTVLIKAKVENGMAEGSDYTQDFKIVFTVKLTDNEGETPVVHVTDITLNDSTLSITIGSTAGNTATLTHTLTPSNATNQNVTWVSSNPSVATVDSDGVVTAVTVGTTTITVTTADGNKTATCNITVAVSIEMVQISDGTFNMGSPQSETGSFSDERPQHQVTLTQNFYIGKYEVTQEQYQAVMGKNPSHFKTAVGGESGTPGKLPVEMVSWYDALVFCNKLSIAEGLTPAYKINNSTNPAEWGTVPTSNNATWNAVAIVANSNGYRLPTEAQWEYACRAGTTTAYNTTDQTNDIGWYNTNSGNKTHKVGLKTPNAWELYDMHGNVYEWCWDLVGSYQANSQTDPTGASSGSTRIIRGGSWQYENIIMRSACRSDWNSHLGDTDVGFRIIRYP